MSKHHVWTTYGWPASVPRQRESQPSTSSWITGSIGVYEYSSLLYVLNFVFQCVACHWTHYHTEPFKITDAESLLACLNNPALAILAAVPPQLRPPSPVTPTPTATQGNRINCTNTSCFTKQGPRTQGSKTCIEHKCKTCCIRAVSKAEMEGVGRARCNAHVQPAFVSRIVLSRALPSSHILPPTTNSSGVPIQLPQCIIEPIMLSVLASTSHPNEALLTPPSTQPIPPLRPPVCMPMVPHLPQPTALRRSLAQPLDNEWATVHTAAKQEKHQMKSLKIQQQEMEERKRRTCQLIIYHTVSSLAGLF